MWIVPGTVGFTEEKKQYAYVLVVRLKNPEGGFPETTSNSGLKESTAFAYARLVFGEESAKEYLEFDYRATASGGRIEEHFSIDGEAIDLTKGRVFVIDYSGDKKVQRQLDVVLPDPVEDEKIGERCKKIVDRLKSHKHESLELLK
ncbi:MAG: hypothetical protein ACRDD1_08245 [Planctomycetia bacterium]